MRGAAVPRPIDPVLLVILHRRIFACLTYSLGSTGSLSSARIANTGSWTRYRGSPRARRSNASTPRANSRNARPRFDAEATLAQALELIRARVVGPIDDPQVLPTPDLDGRLNNSLAAARDEVHGLVQFIQSQLKRRTNCKRVRPGCACDVEPSAGVAQMQASPRCWTCARGAIYVP